MSWFPVDDAFHSHPKARKAGMEAVGLWTLAGSHCMAYLTDGFVALWWIKEKPRGAVLAKRLVDAGLWRTAKRDGEQGFQFHDWKPECTKAHVMAMREKARQRKAKSRESHSSSHVTDGVSPASCLVPTQPNPTQPINSLVTSSGEVTKVDASDPPPKFCPKHPHGTDTSCRPCGTRRKIREAWDADELKHRRLANSAIKAARDACGFCDENGMRELRHGLTRCDHQEVEHA